MSEYSGDSGRSPSGYWEGDTWIEDPSRAQSQALTAENLGNAYKKMFGTEAPQEWVQQTQAAYDPNNTLEHVMYNAALGKASDSTPFANASGDQGGFTSGAGYYLKQGYIPSGQTYEGVPTQFIDPKTGKVVASYGILQEAGGNPKSTASNAWRWNEAVNTPQGYETALAMPRTDWNSAFREGLTGAAFALSPVIAGYGLSAMGALDGLGAGLGGAEAFPVLGGEAIPATELGAAGSTAGAGGLTAAEAFKYGQYGLKGLGALQSLAGMGGGQGLQLPQGGQGGQGYGSTIIANTQGPWNTHQKAGMIKQDIVDRKPIMDNPQLASLYGDIDPYLSNQLAQRGITPSNLGNIGGQSYAGVPSASYYNYGTPPQTDYFAPLMAAKGGHIENPLETVSNDGEQPHVPEFITGATGHYVKGRGDGQSDDIPAMLADGEYVFDADTVAALGNGSSDAGAKVLDKMREALREHKRSAPVDEIPPKAKSPLEYIKEGMKRK